MEQNHCTTKTGKWKQMTERDRYKIEAYFQAGLKPQEIAAYIGCSKRTIERERRLGMTAQLKPATKNIKTCGDLQVQGDKAGNFNIGRTADAEITLCSDKEQESKKVLQALRRLQRRVKGDFTHVFKSITADNGAEFLDGEGMKRAAKCGEVYYAHPYSSWERGSNENGNRMLRRFLPKGTDFSKLKPKELQRIEDWVNDYPRKIFGYKSANDMYAAMI